MKLTNTAFVRAFLALLFLLLSACGTIGTGSSPTAAGPRTFTVMTHDSFAVSEDVVKKFEQANNAAVTFLPSGDAGAALNKAILAKDAPLADLFYGVDNTF